MPDRRGGYHTTIFLAKPFVPVPGYPFVYGLADKSRNYNKGIKHFSGPIEVSAYPDGSTGKCVNLSFVNKNNGIYGSRNLVTGSQALAGSRL